jgi:predicted dehydrogenase
MAAIRTGIIGASRVATYALIAPARVVPGVQVLGIAARDADRSRSYAEEHGIERAYASYDDLFADPDVDLVYVSTPPSTHKDLALAAIRAGKPALVEKPFGLNAAEAREVFAASETSGVVIIEAMHSPHHRLFARMMEIIASNEIGRVREIDAEFSTSIARDDPIRWEHDLGGGALSDLGVYPLAWARRIAGEEFTVEHTQAVFERGVDAQFSSRLRFAGDVQARVRSSMQAATTTARLSVRGSKGEIIAINPLAPQHGHELRISSDRGERSEVVAGPSSFEAQLSAVAATLRDGAPFPFPRDDYVRSMDALDLVRASFE